jgi:hypothetical protein
MPAIHFKTKPFKIGSWTILKLPKEASAKLPSRGMTMVEGTINGSVFQSALEPDGRGSHWFRIGNNLGKTAKITVGDTVELEVEPSKVWPRPEVPEGLKEALAKAPQAQALWMDITPNAQWEWIRWIRAAKQPETRKRHIEVACSKMKNGERRPCCFNRNLCSEPYVSHNWLLREPVQK